MAVWEALLLAAASGLCGWCLGNINAWTPATDEADRARRQHRAEKRRQKRLQRAKRVIAKDGRWSADA